jgi:hypothetical protein
MPGRRDWEAEVEAQPAAADKTVEQSHGSICQDPSGEDTGMTQDVIVLEETEAQ